MTCTADIVGINLHASARESEGGGGANFRLLHNAVYGSDEVLAKFEGPALQKLMPNLWARVVM